MNKKVLIGIIIVALVLVAGYFLSEVEDVIYTAEEAEEIAEDWVRDEAPTFTERGGHELTHVDTEEVEDSRFRVTFDFNSNFAGYGTVGEDEAAAQVITPHTIVVTVEENEVIGAFTDEIFNEMTEEMVDEENGDEEETASVDLYFVEIIGGVEDIVAINREIEVVNGVEESAIVALLCGLTEDEDGEEISSSIPEGVELLSFELEEGVATVDFSAEIDPGGGSAWVTSIRDQIEQTLTQFDSVDEVIILVEGEEDALQP